MSILSVLCGTFLTACSSHVTDSYSKPPDADVTAPAACPRNGEGLVPPFDGKPATTAPPHALTPERVIRCAVDPAVQERADGSLDYTVRQQETRATASLLDALALPDTPRPSSGNVQCDANAEPIVYLLLVDASGKALKPHVPADWCGSPRPEVVNELQHASWRTTQTYHVIRKP